MSEKLSTEIEGEFNNTLQGDAEQFGGKGQSTTVPTCHIRVTSEDLAHFADTKEPLVIENIAIVWREDATTEHPDVDFVIFVSQTTLERLADGRVVNYGIRQINGENQMLHISKGGVSDLFEDDRSPTQRIREDKPHLRRYL